MPITNPTAASDNPHEIHIRRGMPAVDMCNEVIGRVWGVTAGSCLIRTPQQLFHLAPWNDVALGNIRPAREDLPVSVAELDRLEYYAQALCELDHARDSTINRHLEQYRDLPPELEAARRFLIKRLKIKKQAK